MAADKSQFTPSTKEEEAPQATVQPDGQPRIKWDDSKMRSSYANVCNVSSTREEMVLLFGINQAWNAAQREVTVQLTDRIILSPFAAKRLSALLANVVREHETRFGEVDIDRPLPKK